VRRQEEVITQLQSREIEEAPAAVDQHVFLIGRPPISEFLGFVKCMAVDGQARSQAVLVEAWRQANDHVKRLEQAEAGIADNVETAPLPAELDLARLRLEREPLFRASTQCTPVEIAIVELDKLVVFQKNIDLAHIANIRARLPRKPTPQQIFDLCLPSEPERPGVRMMQIAPNSFTFVSPSNDFRFLQTQVLGPEQLGQSIQNGHATDVIGLAFGFSANYLTAISLERRLVLGNGSHRAYALREHGVTHAPCLVQRFSRREELELAPVGLQQHPDRCLRDARPPILKDYLDPALRMIVPVVRKHRLIKLTFGVEAVDIPAA